MMSSYRFRTVVMRVIIYALLVLLLAITIIPIWLLVVNATRSTTEIQQGMSLLPSTNLGENFRILESKGIDMVQGFSNSLFIALSTTFITVYFSMLAAYGLVIYKFRGRRFLTAFVVVLVLIPMQFSIIGFYQYMSRLGLTDNYASLILPSIATATALFFSIQYLKSIRIQELIDAGRIDGASEIGIFHRIMMPIAIPGAATLGIFAFVASWNNFFNAFILISSLDKYTLPMLVQTLRGDVYRTEYGAIYLGLAIIIVPIIIMYAIFSKYIISGIAMGAIKE